MMKKLIALGIQGLEHGALMDKETARMLEDSNTYLVPTFCPYEDAIHYDADAQAKKSAEYRRKMAIIFCGKSIITTVAVFGLGVLIAVPIMEYTGDIHHSRNVVVIPDGSVDRSPCGTGTAALAAYFAAKGQLHAGDSIVSTSIIGSSFSCRV